MSFSASRRRLLNLPSFHVTHHYHSGCLGCFAWRMLCRLADRGGSRTDALPSRSLFRRMLCCQGRTWVDALPLVDAWTPSCYWCLLYGCFAAQVVISGCFATVWKASSVMVYPLCRFSSRVAGWVAKLVVASLFMLLLLYVTFVAVRWVCSPFSVFLFRLSLVLLGRSSPVWRLQEMFVNCFLLNEIRAKARSRKKTSQLSLSIDLLANDQNALH